MRVIEATPDNFDSLLQEHSKKLIIVDFWGLDCPNCEFFASEWPKLEAKLVGRNITVFKVNAYVHMDLATRFGLHGIPTFLFFHDGKQLGRMSRYYGEEYWLKVVDELCEKIGLETS